MQYFWILQSYLHETPKREVCTRDWRYVNSFVIAYRATCNITAGFANFKFLAESCGLSAPKLSTEYKIYDTSCRQAGSVHDEIMRNRKRSNTVLRRMLGNLNIATNHAK